MVSVGSPGNERQITNVAAGRISSTSTDAINGSQLDATNQAIGAVTVTANKGWSLSANGEAVPQNIAPGGTANFQQGDNIEVTRTGNTLTISTAKNVTFDSVTTGSTVMNNAGIMIGPNVSLGSTGLVILGGPSVSVTGINAGGMAITNVGIGVNPTDAVNFSQLTSSTTTAANTWITGSPTAYAAPVSIGANSTAVGSGASVNANGSLALGTGANASVANSVALGNGSTTSAAVGTSGTTIQGNNYSFQGANPSGVVSVGSAGSERQIQNVAAGRLSATSTDAVNGSQLHATNQALNSLGVVAGAGINLTTAQTGSGVVIGTSVANMGLGGTATHAAGNNMVLTQSGTSVTYAVSDNPNFTSVKVGKTTVTNDGIAIQGGPSMAASGIDAGGRRSRTWRRASMAPMPPTSISSTPAWPGPPPTPISA